MNTIRQGGGVANSQANFAGLRGESPLAGLRGVSPGQSSNGRMLKPKKHLIPSFMLEEIRNYKPFLTPSFNLKRDFEHQKFKIYKPYLM